MARKRIKKQLLALPARDRAELAHLLIASLDEEGKGDPSAESDWDVELQRRSEEIQSGRAEAMPAAGVFSELRHKYG